MKLQPIKIGDLEVKIPIIQGGMGVGISRYNLAGHVALAGGVGIISTAQIGYDEDDYEKNPLEANLRAIGKHIRKAREIANGGVIGVNIMVATQSYEEYVKASVEAGADLIVCGAGLPIELPKLVEGSKTLIAPIVSSIKSAFVICKMWDRKYQKAPDLVVIEGPKAGGHLGFTNEQLETITDEEYDIEIKGIIETVKEYAVKYAKKIPIIVAGGIFNKADVKKCMDLGADGVQVASRFVTTKECDASDAFKQAYINSKKEDIIIVKSPVGMPGRAINNDFIKKSLLGNTKIERCYNCIKGCKKTNIPYCISNALISAVKGNVDNGLVFCGANAYKCVKMETVQEVFDDLSEY